MGKKGVDIEKGPLVFDSKCERGGAWPVIVEGRRENGISQPGGSRRDVENIFFR